MVVTVIAIIIMSSIFDVIINITNIMSLSVYLYIYWYIYHYH